MWRKGRGGKRVFCGKTYDETVVFSSLVRIHAETLSEVFHELSVYGMMMEMV